MNRLTSERLDHLLERARDARLLVVGDVMLDVYLSGSASRISPEAPVPVVHVSDEWRTLGGAANVAHNVVALGAQCELVGVVGRDAASTDMRAVLKRAGIAANGLHAAPSRPTTVKTRVLVRNHQVARYDQETDQEVDAGLVRALCGVIQERAPHVDAIVLEDYNKGVLVPAVIAAALDAARRFDRPLLVDPKHRHFFDYGGATVFKPNLSELAAALRAPLFTDDAQWMERTRRRLGCHNLLVTLGEDGMSLVTEGAELVRVPATARAVYDVSGAGDTVTAALAVALAAGATVIEGAILANHAAGIEVGKPGVATVSPDELRLAVGQLGASAARVTPADAVSARGRDRAAVRQAHGA